jgi:2-methylcitrate dehydratase PrpD
MKRKPYTRLLAEWTSALRFEDIPADVVAAAKNQIINMLGGILPGSATECGKMASTAVKAWGDRPEATAIGFGFKTSARSAAFLNSITGQILEYEDAILPYAHVGSAIVPTALALAEVKGASGKDIITAVVVGDEVGGRAGFAMHQGRHMGNSIPVYQIVTPFVAAKLLGYDLTKTMDTIGGALLQIQQTLLPGWVSYAKTYLSAMPVLTGISAAYLAGEGFCGYWEPIEDPYGYISQSCERPIFDVMDEELGTKWWTTNMLNKPYPVCGWDIPAIECALYLVNTHPIDPDRVKEVRLKLPTQSVMGGTMWHGFDGGRKEVLERIKRRHDFTFVSVQYEFHYPVAAAIVDKEFTPRQWTDERLFDKKIGDIADKIVVVPDIALTTAYVREHSLGSEVTIVMDDGTEYTHGVAQTLGGPGTGFMVEDKFTKEAAGIIGEKRAKAALEMLVNFQDVDDVAPLMEYLR